MNQGDLFVTVIARRKDPDTSHEAARAFEQPKAQRSVSVAVAIIGAAGHPLSDFQIRERWGALWEGPFSDSLPCKARHWAREAGLVRHAGYSTHVGRRVRIWELGRDEEFLSTHDH